ncbi:MAG: hypothetical protein J6C05_02015 [Prevotella sp.]|nr:hypothetical protein [Prevotella sp.]MBO5155901.1 hypothetical protein [Prevotella sp.]
MMRQLNKTENVIFIVGAIMMVAGCVANILRFAVAPYIYSVGAVAYAVMQIRQSYDGANITVRRLRRIMILSDFLLLFTGVMMFADRSYDFMGLDLLVWLQYVHNNWVITLLIAALMQLYTIYRISSELE